MKFFLPALVLAILSLGYLLMVEQRSILFFPFEVPALILSIFLSLNSWNVAAQTVAMFVSFFIVYLIYIKVVVAIYHFARGFRTNLRQLRLKERESSS